MSALCPLQHKFACLLLQQLQSGSIARPALRFVTSLSLVVCFFDGGCSGRDQLRKLCTQHEALSPGEIVLPAMRAILKYLGPISQRSQTRSLAGVSLRFCCRIGTMRVTLCLFVSDRLSYPYLVLLRRYLAERCLPTHLAVFGSLAGEAPRPALSSCALGVVPAFCAALAM